MDAERKKQYLKFRGAFLQEELNELQLAIDNNNKEEIVDALIDISVVALGTLDFFNVDINKAWDAVLKANLDKEPGIKPNPYNLPDLIKPTYWTPPNHKHNTGDL
jgi:predicted HAD superfamily Cof-like phosphohydrolase